MKKKMVITIVIMSFLSGLLFLHTKNNADEENIELVDNINVMKSDYSLDDLYNYVKSNDFSSLNHNNIGYVYTHFYEYFNQDTNFLVISKYNSKTNEVIETKFISYDEYMNKMQPIYEKLNNQNISKNDTIWNSLSLFLINYFFTEYV